MSKPSLLLVWVAAARLRTLPLSIAGIVLGNAVAINTADFSWSIFVGTLLTAVAFQILSNFANDYGDGIKGTDNDNRIGPKRVLQQNLLTPKTLFQGIVVVGILGLLLAITTINFAFNGKELTSGLVFLGLALAAIVAAYKYTAGKGAYGYHALGDLFVFLFFGLLAVYGSYYLQTKQFDPTVWWFAVAIGTLSVGVLNLNNMRDIQNDTAMGKKTVAAALGLQGAKNYHTVLILVGIASMVFGLVPIANNMWDYLPLILTIPLLLQLISVRKTNQYNDFDKRLKPLALTTFGLSVILFITQYTAS